MRLCRDRYGADRGLVRGAARRQYGCTAESRPLPLLDQSSPRDFAGEPIEGTKHRVGGASAAASGPRHVLAVETPRGREVQVVIEIERKVGQIEPEGEEDLGGPVDEFREGGRTVFGKDQGIVVTEFPIEPSNRRDPLERYGVADRHLRSTKDPRLVNRFIRPPVVVLLVITVLRADERRFESRSSQHAHEEVAEIQIVAEVRDSHGERCSKAILSKGTSVSVPRPKKWRCPCTA